ncbi:chemotaxis protein CheW [Aquisphaera insulae]|uniref:chemotaxis protein CheW n=1 Tax=Aquisphaera insulae TaxID=2712864 RepID=UPI00202FEF33|nr:chemotaxis protein CheW [Aquisphaera insulae]
MGDTGGRPRPGVDAMLLLTFRAAGSRYAVDVKRVVEVVPRVELRALPHAPGSLVGVFDYRGRVVPVVDLGLLFGGPRSADRLSTRVILVDARAPEAEAAATARQRRLLGLIAEQVSDVSAVKPAQMISARMQLPQSPYLGPIVEIGQEMVQLVAAEHILEPPLQDAFFAPGAAGTPAGS